VGALNHLVRPTFFISDLHLCAERPGISQIFARFISDTAPAAESVYSFVRTAGPSISPFNAWICLKGMETLRIRMEAQSSSALKLAHWLVDQEAVTHVHYAGLPSHPQHALALRQALAQGAVVSFEVKGGREAAWRVIDAVKMISITANLGDTKTTITHPATTTHARVSQAERDAAGISEGLLRVAVGLENIEDICADLQHGLPAQQLPVS